MGQERCQSSAVMIWVLLSVSDERDEFEKVTAFTVFSCGVGGESVTAGEGVSSDTLRLLVDSVLLQSLDDKDLLRVYGVENNDRVFVCARVCLATGRTGGGMLCFRAPSFMSLLA